MYFVNFYREVRNVVRFFYEVLNRFVRYGYNMFLNRNFVIVKIEYIFYFYFKYIFRELIYFCSCVLWCDGELLMFER